MPIFFAPERDHTVTFVRSPSANAVCHCHSPELSFPADTPRRSCDIHPCVTAFEKPTHNQQRSVIKLLGRIYVIYISTFDFFILPRMRQIAFSTDFLFLPVRAAISAALQPPRYSENERLVRCKLAPYTVDQQPAVLCRNNTLHRVGHHGASTLDPPSSVRDIGLSRPARASSRSRDIIRFFRQMPAYRPKVTLLCAVS